MIFSASVTSNHWFSHLLTYEHDTNSCSHAGIVNVVKDAIEQFARPVYMVSSVLYIIV